MRKSLIDGFYLIPFKTTRLTVVLWFDFMLKLCCVTVWRNNGNWRFSICLFFPLLFCLLCFTSTGSDKKKITLKLHSLLVIISPDSWPTEPVAVKKTTKTLQPQSEEVDVFTVHSKIKSVCCSKKNSLLYFSCSIYCHSAVSKLKV